MERGGEARGKGAGPGPAASPCMVMFLSRAPPSQEAAVPSRLLRYEQILVKQGRTPLFNSFSLVYTFKYLDIRSVSLHLEA